MWQQAAAADYELLDGPARRMRWSVSDPALHDDLLISAALVAHLDTLDWARYRKSKVIEATSLEW